MSEPGPVEGSNPLERLPFFAELAGIADAEGPVHWDVARRVAAWVAGGGRPEPPVEPADVTQLRELGRVAELRLAGVTSLPAAPAETPLVVAAVTRAEWALRALDAHRPLLEALARSLAGGRPPDPGHRPAGLAPSVLDGLIFGWMMGQLSRRALGQYDPPLPRPPSGRLSIVPANLDEVAGEWGLPLDEVRLWACLQDVAHHAVLGLPHVRGELGSLLRRYVEAFQVAPDALAEELEALDPADPTSFRAALGDPEAVLAAVQTPAQADVVARLEALAAAVEGWVGHVVDGIGGRLLSSYPSLQEVVRRRRAEASWGDRYVARLLGMGLRQPAHERGRRFVDGVVERAGEEALARLWASDQELPTPAEVDAPGLWLARIELGDGG
ncbi:MAG: zinc-dependent metalloprotease [Actinomycetota bacterium]|nr:zinc-dependent metalloprotease [Actinomycetota bacterium]